MVLVIKNSMIIAPFLIIIIIKGVHCFEFHHSNLYLERGIIHSKKYSLIFENIFMIGLNQVIFQRH